MATWADTRVDLWRRDGLLRQTAPLDRNLVNFSGNDYLGLSSHPRVIEAATRALRDGGMGPRGSALICGYTDAHAALETRIAQHCGTEACLLFPTGYAANVATVTALGGPDCALFSDALNHASLIDGCRLARRAGTEVHVYPHGDTTALASLLTACDRPRRIILTESVFSMDGDRAPMDALAALRDQHGAWLVCDEAHATLLFPPHPGVDVYIGTLSKAVGALGGFAAGPAPVREVLLNAGRPFVFSTALPVPVVLAAHTSFDVAADEAHHLRHLRRHVARVGAALGRPNHETPIVPVVIGSADDTMAASARLRSRGFHIPGIRPPTVPNGTSRLRIALSASHSEAEISAVIDAVLQLGPNT
jgi:8-amino-7-oxononanoate synthase